MKGKPQQPADLKDDTIMMDVVADAEDPLDPQFPSTPVRNGTDGKENQRPINNITPDLFQDADDLSSSSFRDLMKKSMERSGQSLKDSMDTMKTPRFAACAEVLLPVTERRSNKRRISLDDGSMLEATPMSRSIERLVLKKAKHSTPSILTSEEEEQEVKEEVKEEEQEEEGLLDSSIIPSTNPSDELSLTEVDTEQRFQTFVEESLLFDRISLSIFKEKQSVLGLALSWSIHQVSVYL